MRCIINWPLYQLIAFAHTAFRRSSALARLLGYQIKIHHFYGATYYVVVDNKYSLQRSEQKPGSVLFISLTSIFANNSIFHNNNENKCGNYNVAKVAAAEGISQRRANIIAFIQLFLYGYYF